MSLDFEIRKKEKENTHKPSFFFLQLISQGKVLEHATVDFCKNPDVITVIALMLISLFT